MINWGLIPQVTVPPAPKRSYDPSKMLLTVCKGDTITYNWSGTHGISATNAAQWVACNIVTSTVIIAPVAGSTFTAVAKKPGMKYYYCPVPGHCSGGK